MLAASQGAGWSVAAPAVAGADTAHAHHSNPAPCLWAKDNIYCLQSPVGTADLELNTVALNTGISVYVSLVPEC